MTSALNQQNKDLTGKTGLNLIRETAIASVLGLTLSTGLSPAMSQIVTPQMEPQVPGSVPSSAKWEDKAPASREGNRSLTSGTTRTAKSPREPRLRSDHPVPESSDSLVISERESDRHLSSTGTDSTMTENISYPAQNQPAQNQPRSNQGDFSPDLLQEPRPQKQILASLDFQPNPEKINQNPDPETDPLGQITSVSQLSDVKPTDWAYTALQSLVERYGCISGYPDLTYRGDRALTRYEFVAALNACWEQIEQIIQTNQNSQQSQEDLLKLQQLHQNFAKDLAIFNQQIETLNTQTTTLEAQQFSTTTKLFGQAIFGLQGRTANQADFFPVDDQKDTKDPGTEINFLNNIQLTLLTQLNSRSLILAGMQVGNGGTGPRLNNDTRLGYEGNTEGQIILSDLNYRQLIGNRLAVIVGPAGVNMANVFRGVNEVESAGRGAVSALAQRNPIVNIGNGRGGVGFDWQATSRISIQGVYSASTPADVSSGGLFGGTDGQTTLGLQLTLAPINSVNVALNYVNAYSPLGVLGTGSGDDQLTIDSPIKTNGFGAAVSWRITPDLTLGSWAGYTNSGIPGQEGEVETTNWMLFLNWENLFGRDNLAGIYVGQPPKIVRSDLPVGKNIPDLLAGGEGKAGGQPGTTTHLELFYRWQVSDRLSLTPGLLMIFEPGHTPASDPITVGVLRTTFNF